MQIFSYDETRRRAQGNRLRQFPSIAKGRARFLPYARPAIAGVDLPPNASFYVLGACFARNLERALGFAGQRVLSSPIGLGLPGSTAEQFQRYNVFNLDVALNELTWALTAMDSGACKALLPVAEKLADTQLNWTFAHDPEIALSFRQIYNKSYASVTDADVVILATGGIEQWFDKEEGIYINSMPGPVSDNLYPGRFELHRIGVDEAVCTLEKTIALIRTHSTKKPIFYIAVSPVSQPMVFSPEDILIDQFYAKVVQRQAVEQIVQADDRCLYLPALEAAMWTDFRYNYQETSMNHTTPNFGARIVADLLDACGVQDHEVKAHRALAHGIPMLEGGNTAGAIALCEEALVDDCIESGEVDALYVRALGKAHRHREAVEHIFRRLESEDFVPQMLEELVNIEGCIVSQAQKDAAVSVAIRHEWPVARLKAINVDGDADPVAEARSKLAVIANVLVGKDFDTAARLANDMLPHQSELGQRDRARLYQMLIRALLAVERGKQALEASLLIMRSDLRYEPAAFGAAERAVRLHASADQMEEVLAHLRPDFPEDKLANLERILLRLKRRSS